MFPAVPRKLTLALPEGDLELDLDDAPSPTALWAMIGRSVSPLVLFDFESARVTHANDAMERHMACPAPELRQLTGRGMMPADCAVLTEVISEALNARDRYVGPTVLRHGGREVVRSMVDILVLSHGGRRYGVDVYGAAFEPGGGRPKILIVDDDGLVLSTLERLFRREVEVVTARNAHEGMEALATDPDIGCVLSDVEMPGHGVRMWKACRLLRPDLEERFVFFSGGRSTEREAPGVPFFPKSLPIPELRAQVLDRLR